MQDESGSFTEHDGNITPQPPPEREGIKRNLSEGGKASSVFTSRRNKFLEKAAFQVQDMQINSANGC